MKPRSALNYSQYYKPIVILTLLVAFLVTQPSVAIFAKGTLLFIQQPVKGQTEVLELKIDQPILRELSGGETHTYRITLNVKQYLKVVVEQKGIDVFVILFGPEGQKLTEADSPIGSQGPEPVALIADVPGEYRLAVRSLDEKAAPGKYEIKIVDLRESHQTDRDGILLERTLAEAERLRVQGTAESLFGAIKKYSEALPLLRMVDSTREAATLNRIGVIYWQLGENQKALEYYSQAQVLWRAMGDRRNEATSLHNVGTVYLQLGDSQKALVYYSEALPLWRAVKDRRAEATTLSAIGVAYMRLGRLRDALEHYNQSLPLRRAVEDFWGETNTLNNIAATYLDLGDVQKALEFDKKALLLSRELAYQRGEAIALSGMGACYSALEKQEEALKHLSQALILHRAVGDRNSEVKTLQLIARAERELGQLTAARAHIEAALEIIESIRGKVASQELRASYLASTQDRYEFYIDLLMRLHRQQPSAGYDGASFEAAERSRARSLLEILTEAHADIRQGVALELLERERSTQQQLSVKSERLTRLLSAKHTEAQEKAAKEEVEDLLTDYQDLASEIRTKSPRYAALTQPQPLSLKEIQQLLDENTLVLEYALGKERSYLWAVTQTSVTSFELPGRAEIEATAFKFYELLTTSKNRELDAQAQAATALSHLLLTPVANHLGRKRLLIVTDGALHYIPFAVLPEPVVYGRRQTVGPKTISEYQPLLVNHEIVSLPSVSVLAVVRRELAGRTPSSNRVAVLADPVFRTDDPRIKPDTFKLVTTSNVPLPRSNADFKSKVERSAWESAVENLPRLQHSRREAEAIVATMPSRQVLLALDFAANRETVVSGQLEQYRIIHFATHSLLNNVHPELSGIVLSLVDEAGRPQNGFVRLHEVYNLKLPAELVVLSGCRTALGKEVKGEGLIGLTRGFMYAGAARVVVSLWTVSDEGTAELMKRFYQGMLGKGLRPAAALRAAQIAMWKSKWWEAPYYWGGFVLEGEWR